MISFDERHLATFKEDYARYALVCIDNLVKKAHVVVMANMEMVRQSIMHL